MAHDILKFAILGLGAGAVYGVTGLGVVLVYRGSGVVNFAHGAIGMVCAFVFYKSRQGGTDTLMCWVYALGVAAAFGAAMHLVVMRTLRQASALTRLIATLAVFTILYAWKHDEEGEIARIVPKLLSVRAVEVLPDITIGVDRLILLGFGVVVTVVLTIMFRATKFGLATTAVAESRRITAAQGISPDVVATINWVLGSLLAATGAIFIVNIAGLQLNTLTLLIVPGLAAALVGSFRSLALTLAGGLLIGILQSEILWLQSYLTEQRGEVVTLSGWADTVPFLVIIAVLIVRGRALPLRGESVDRPPAVGTGRVPAVVVGGGVVLTALLVSFAFSTTLVEAVTTSAAIGVILLSFVVVTGFGGQLSLAQMALAGMGGWICASLVANEGVSFELAILAGVLGAIPVGVVVGIPSLRTRGVNLAVATLGLALVIQAQVLGNADRTGGITGLDVGPPKLFGIDFDPFKHHERYALLAVGAFTLMAIIVSNLRRGRSGRRLVAVRTNERAAAALGINVFGAKLFAFGLGAGIAAVGGILIVLRRPTAVFIPGFSVFESIFVVVYAVLGGVGFIFGALVGGAFAPGGWYISFIDEVIVKVPTDATVQVVLGCVLLLTLWLNPDGVGSYGPMWLVPVRSWKAGVEAWFKGRQDDLPELERERVPPRTLEVEGIGVRFGGTVALDDVSLALRPGEVLGLIGPNGAGKTTLIDAVTGFVRATGDMRLDGVSMARWSPRRRARAGLGRSFQSLELFESMTVRENLRTASDRRDPLAYLTDLVWPRRTSLGAPAVAAVREFGLEEDLDRKPNELPYGRRRLVAIARALAAEPSVLMLDEPAAGLDDTETTELGHLLRRLADEWGLAVLLVEHDVALVLRVCDRVTVLDAGRHLASGTPDEILHDPAVLAAYLGEPADAEEVEPSVAASARAPVAAGASIADALEPLIEARGLSAGYGDLAAVRDLDLAVHPGEIVALLGPNGAGKTTTLLTLAGELRPLAGEVRFLGAPRRWPVHKRVRQGLGFVPEERGVIAALNAGGNLRLGRGSVEDAVELFPELAPRLKRRAGLLSGGEQQMLTLGRALAAEPRLLLVDELSLGLAPLVVERLLRAIRAAADRGVGVLLVEQHAGEALRFADRALVLRHGHVELEGAAADLRSHLGDLESAYLTGMPST
ncbi:MAG: ATP-binding cassette domain-containing protein [Acidimicrobiia bacterium]